MATLQAKIRNQGHKNILLGAHFSIAGGLHKAVLTAAQYQCTALQIFTKNASTWKEIGLSADDIDQFHRARKKTKIQSICSHASYLINLASPDRRKHDMSLKALEHELVRSSRLGIAHVILHPGSHMGLGEDNGLRRIAQGINTVLQRLPDTPCQLVLETTAGQGSNVGYRFEHLAKIADMVQREEKLGFCFDTCHVFAAGYDLRTTMAYQDTIRAFDKTIGLRHLWVIHLNDSKKALGSHVDRHEHIGAGAIGIETFRLIMNDPRFKAVPKMLETPKPEGLIDYDHINLERLRALVLN